MTTEVCRNTPEYELHSLEVVFPVEEAVLGLG
jgi:hypothetical protein